MSIKTQIDRLTANVAAALEAIASKSVTVPTGVNSNHLSALIDAIPLTIPTDAVKVDLSGVSSPATDGVSRQIERLKGNIQAALTSVSGKNVTVPEGATSDDLADLIASIVQSAANAIVYVYGALSETVTLTHTDGTVYTIDTNANGASDTTLDLPFGEYTVTGTVSVDALPSGRTVTVSSETTVVTAYPDGAVFWFGNGYTAGDTLYYQGFAEKAWRYSGDGEAATSGGTVSLDGTRILCKLSGVGNSTGYAFSCFREGAVDMTDYTSLNCYGKTSGGYTGGYSGWLIATDDYANNYSRSAYKTFGNNSLGTKTADVSGLSGNYYIALEASAKYYGGNGSVTLTAYAIWLE